MDISDKRKPTTVEFGSLKAGECFIDEEGCFCMVIEDTDHICIDYSAVDLENGKLYYFNDDQQITKVNTRLEVF